MTRYHCLVLRVKLVSEQQHSYTISSARAPPADVNSVKVYPSHKLTLRILLSPRQSIHHTCYSLVSLGKTCKGTSFSCGRSGSASCLRSAGQQGYCHFLYDLGGSEGMWRRWRTEGSWEVKSSWNFFSWISTVILPLSEKCACSEEFTLSMSCLLEAGPPSLQALVRILSENSTGAVLVECCNNCFF